ncbi:TATA-box-binding protein [Halorubrum trueperi]|uniref:TATA-box-binding protein n=1 Tax=Halorubrum trueperi TaxID=2004704 RepID=A0ABD5UTY4_9EURY
MVEVVNVVASGSLGIDLDLEAVAKEARDIANFNPNKYPGMYLRFEEDAPLITVYRTGKFIITGSDSEEESYSLRERFLNLFSDMDVIEEPEDEWFSIQNYVCTAELRQNLNLTALSIGLGLEKIEYEPEQFPGLIYRPEGADGVVLLFATGKVIITGCQTLEAAEDIFADLTETVSELL